MKKATLQKYYLFLSVFVSGAVVLVIEILGTRIISPFFGATIFVWSSLIVVTLGFLSLGYFFGGKWVDKNPHRDLLGKLIFAAAVFTALILKVDEKVLPFSDQFGLKFGPLVSSLILFAPVFFFLGTVGPIVVGLLSKNKKSVGEVVGKVFGISTLGSVSGALVAGFFLIPNFSVTSILYGSSILLAGIALFDLGLSQKWKLFVGLLAVLFFIPQFKDTSYLTVEILENLRSFYGDIKITGTERRKCLYVNGSNQGCVDLTGKAAIDSPLLSQTNELFDALPKDSKVLLLGLGPGMIPPLLSEDIEMDIVEIDPKIARAAESEFLFELKKNQKTYIDDARRFVRLAEPESYDLILEDISLGSHVPYYIFSKESLAEIKKLLKPGGILISHVGIGLDEDDIFANSLVKTFKSVFRNVDVYSSNPELLSNFLIYAYDDESNLSGLANFYYPYKKLEYQLAEVMTDDRNFLDYYYLPYAEIELENSKKIGNTILYAK